MKKTITMILMCIMLCTSFAYAEPNAWNQRAEEILNEYYEPGNYLDTCEYNINTGYAYYNVNNGKYDDKDQLATIKALAVKLTTNCNTDREKVKAIHDWICRNIKYSENLDNYSGYPHDPLCNPYTVFKRREGVCYGFANLTELMLQSVGVPTITVRGNRSSHVWNAVYLNGHWIYTDNTWDENLTGDKISYRYYLMSDETYDAHYRTEYLEWWNGDLCYFPVCTNPNKSIGRVTLDARGGTPSRDKLPVDSDTTILLLPYPERSGRYFYGWMRETGSGDESIDGFNAHGGYWINSFAAYSGTDQSLWARYNKLTPTYDIPQNLIGAEGEKLSTVLLPRGFSWTDPDTVITTSKKYPAIYTPDDEREYSSVNVSLMVTAVDRYAAVTEELQNAQDAFDEAKDAEAEVLTAIQTMNSDSIDFTEAETALNGYKDALINAREKCESIRNTRDDELVKKAISEANEGIAKLEAEKSSLEKEYNKLSAEYGKKKDEWSRAQAQAEVKMSVLKDKIAETESRIEAYQAMVASYQGYESLTEEAETLYADLATLTANLHNIEDALDAANHDKETLESLMAEARSCLDAANKQIESFRVEVREADVLHREYKIKIQSNMFKLSPANFIFTGKAVRPNVITKLPADGYTVTFKNNTDIGEAQAIIKGKNGFEGTVVKEFTILPDNVKIHSLKAKKKKLTITYSTPGSVTYQIYVRKKGSKNWKVYNTTAKKKTIKKLKRKKVYYVKISAYRVVNGVTYGCGFTPTKKIRIK